MKDMKHVIFFSTISAAFLLLSSVAGTSPASDNRGEPTSSSSEVVLNSACSYTEQPELCVSAVSAAATGRETTSHKDVIAAVLDVTISAVKCNHFALKGIVRKRRGLTARAKMAVDVCSKTFDLSLEDLDAAVEGLRLYPDEKNPRRYAAGDLNTLISSAMTYQETCLDGFSHLAVEMMAPNTFQDRVIHVERLCSMALAMIKNMTDTADIENSELSDGTSTSSKIIEEVVGDVDGDGWPLWLSEDDRLLLQSATVTPNTVVAQDGTGNHRTVAEAVAAAPEKSKERYVIKIKEGVYKEYIEVPSNKQRLMFVGDGRLNTIITGNRSYKGGWETFDSATVAVTGNFFLARDITFENTAGASNEQAVAIRLGADLSAFYRCGFSAYQDTLYIHSKRQFFRNCFVAGTIDFIFGNSAAVLQNCDIDARKPNPKQKNMVTAQGRTDKNQDTGIVIQNCRINATSDLWPVMDEYPSYLGRPWKEYSRTVVMQSSISQVIQPEGWAPWNSSNFYLDTLTYREYANRGPGANTSGRVKWKGFKVITNPKEAEPYTAGKFIDGGNWLPGTGFPYQLDL